MEYDSTKICGAIEAILIARNAVNEGKIIPIEPCVSFDSKGQEVLCKYLDETGKTGCTYEGGYVLSNNHVDCPAQKGALRVMRDITGETLAAYHLEPSDELVSPIKQGARIKKERRKQVYF